VVFSKDRLLAGYDVDDYKAPILMTPTPKKRKRPASGVVNDRFPAEADSLTSTRTKNNKGEADSKKIKSFIISIKGKKDDFKADFSGKARALRLINNNTVK
jgi:hypothetical protein